MNKDFTGLQIKNFIEACSLIIKRNPKVEQTKLGYALKKVDTSARKQTDILNKELQKQYNTIVGAKEIDLALTDKSGALLYDDNKNFKFDKNGLKELNAARLSFYDSQEASIKEWENTLFPVETLELLSIDEYVTGQITAYEAEALKGFVLPEDIDITMFYKNSYLDNSENFAKTLEEVN